MMKMKGLWVWGEEGGVGVGLPDISLPDTGDLISHCLPRASEEERRGG